MLTNEEHLIRSCQDGDRKAYHQIYQKHSPVMFAICLRYARCRADAEDILQEGFTRIFEAIKQYEHRGSFEGWMKRIMANCALAHYRKKTNVHYVEDIYDHQQNKVTSHNAVDEISRQELLAMVQQLPDGCRTVFNMYAIEGYSHKEIAQHLGVSEGTSKSQLSDARKRLKQLINKSMLVARAKEI